ncbi:MAG TPA: ABC transporter permease, partial [Vicinamibacteria bacterium]|nr:ABC transporter permease [Vicinamibacteria bacterium]
MRTQVLVVSVTRRLHLRLMESVQSVQDYTLLSAAGLRALVTKPRYPAELVAQMDSLGVGSLSIVVLTGMFTGMVLALQSSATLDVFGARNYVGRLVCVSMVRELGPVLTALMVTGRVGSGMAAELGSMVVTQQIDALRVMGTDPVRRLVAPRIGAALVMIPILTIISNALGIFGAGLISVFSL